MWLQIRPCPWQTGRIRENHSDSESVPTCGDHYEYATSRLWVSRHRFATSYDNVRLSLKKTCVPWWQQVRRTLDRIASHASFQHYILRAIDQMAIHLNPQLCNNENASMLGWRPTNRATFSSFIHRLDRLNISEKQNTIHRRSKRSATDPKTHREQNDQDDKCINVPQIIICCFETTFLNKHRTLFTDWLGSERQTVFNVCKS